MLIPLIRRCVMMETDARKSAAIEKTSISSFMQNAMPSAVDPAEIAKHVARMIFVFLKLRFSRWHSSHASQRDCGVYAGGLFGDFFFTELFVVSSAGRGMRSRGRDGLY